jgi:hypothetical protein
MAPTHSPLSTPLSRHFPHVIARRFFAAPKSTLMENKTNYKARPARPGQCAVCTHPERPRIEMMRATGIPLRVVAEHFGCSKDSIHRHFLKHVSPKRRAELVAGPAAVEELANAAAAESKSLLDYLGIARSVLFSQFLNAAEAGDRNGVVHVAGRLLESLREIGRLTGELRQLSGVTINNNTVNLIGSPEFAALSDGLLAIARRHPQARPDIIDLLRSLDAEPPPKPTHPPMMLIEGEALQ